MAAQPVCVGPGRETRRPVFSRRGSIGLSGSLSYVKTSMQYTADFNICQNDNFQMKLNIFFFSSTAFKHSNLKCVSLAFISWRSLPVIRGH